MNRVQPASSIPCAHQGGGTGGPFAKTAFVLLLLLLAFFPPEATSVLAAVALVICLFVAHFKIDRGLITLTMPLFALFVFGLLQAYQHGLTDVIRDAWTLAKAMVALGVGYFLMHQLRSPQLMFRLVVLAAAILAGLHLLKFSLAFQTYSEASLIALRDEAGGGYFVSVIGLGLLVGVAKIRQFIGFGRWAYFASVLVCGASLAASASRTSIVSLILIVLIMRGWARLRLGSLLLVAVLGGAFLAAVLVFSGNQDNQGELSLIDKFARSATEVAISDYDDMQDINLNWRGFESYRAYLTYLDGNLFQKVFGQGFGATIDLGFYMPLQGTEYRYISVLHNGYMVALIKYGLLGTLVYLYFLIWMIRSVPRAYVQQRRDLLLTRRLISSLGWVLLLSSIVISGVFNKSVFDSSLIVLGAAVAWLNMNNRRGKRQPASHVIGSLALDSNAK